MSCFSLNADILSIAHHPETTEFAVSLVTGHVHAFSYRSGSPTPLLLQQNDRQPLWSTRRHKGACRGLSYSPDGSSIVSVGSDRVIKRANSTTGSVLQKWTDAREEEAAINVVAWINATIFVTGDDAGVIAAWDTSKADPDASCVRVCVTHEDYISSLCGIDGKWVLSTSGDGSIALHDLRSNDSGNSTTLATKYGRQKVSGACLQLSDDQEDDLTCCAIVKSASKKPKVLVGTSEGVVLVFNRSDIGDCNDRILPPARNKQGVKTGKKKKGSSQDEIGVECCAKVDEDHLVIGGSDGKVRLLRVLPNEYIKLIGAFDSGEPVTAVVVHNRMVIAVSGPDVWMWSLDQVAPAASSTSTSKTKSNQDMNNDDDDDEENDTAEEETQEEHDGSDSDGNQFSDSDSDSDAPARKKPKKRKPVTLESKKNTFFDDL